VRELSLLYQELKSFLPMGAGGASNSWVVSGNRSASGLPLLANDPHLVLQLPSNWYEAHLVAPGLDVYGCTMPCVPGVILGHNRSVAWGFTNSGVDVQDLFIERFNQRGEYEFRGEWFAPEHIREVIKVKGEQDVVEEVISTRHGPLLSGNPSLPGTALALRWAALEPAHTTSALLTMNRAADASSFREALRDWHTPSQNVVFADAHGNIGYVMAGVVPIRAKGSGFGPVPGWSGEFEWIAWLGFEELPQLWNPPTGIIVTANNAVVDRDFRWHLSWDWMNGFRAKRIEQLLSEPLFSPEHFKKIQMDVHCIPGLLFAGRCANLKPDEKSEIKALEILLAWDGEATPTSAGAAVYEALILATIRRALEPELGTELISDLLGRSSTPIAPMNLMLGRYTGVLIEALVHDDTSLLPAGSAGWQAILSAALGDAVRLLKEKLGPNPARWQWGQLHRLRLKHPLGAVKPLNLIFDGPDVPVGGDTDTPFQTAFAAHEPFAATAWAPSWRQIVDLSSIDRAVSVYPGGQSGHPRSRHYLDLFPRWYRGDYHPQWIERSEIENHLEGRLLLEPLRSG
jgi:penicillin amidase